VATTEALLILPEKSSYPKFDLYLKYCAFNLLVVVVAIVPVVVVMIKCQYYS
jgi:hypothetical protein